MPIHEYVSYETTARRHSFLKASKEPKGKGSGGVDLPQNGGSAVYPSDAGGTEKRETGLLTYYKGDFQAGKLKWARASGLNTCVGIVLAEQVGGEDRMGYFLAFHIGGGDRAWALGLVSAESTIKEWAGRRAGRVFLAAIAGPQHPGKFSKFRGEIVQVGSAIRSNDPVIAVFWPGAKDDEGPEFPSLGAGKGCLQLFENGFVRASFDS